MTAPQGFATVFPGWNVWDLWQASQPDRGVLSTIWNAGISPDQSLRLWVENQIEDNAPGANLSDPLNPNPEHFRGDEVQIISKPTGLAQSEVRGEIPELAGALQVGVTGSSALPRSVRFYNRGAQTVMPWPHDQNFVVDTVYTPSLTNPITNSQPPKTVGGGLDAAGKAAAEALGEVVTVAAWGLGGIALILLLSNMRKRS